MPLRHGTLTLTAPNPNSNPNQEPSVEELKACIRKGTLANDFVPVLTGTAFKNKGVQVTLTPTRTLTATLART